MPLYLKNKLCMTLMILLAQLSRETTIDNKHIGGYSGTDRKQKVVNYDTLPKTTLRQTLDQPDYGGNVVPDGPKKLQTFKSQST